MNDRDRLAEGERGSGDEEKRGREGERKRGRKEIKWGRGGEAVPVLSLHTYFWRYITASAQERASEVVA